METFEDYDEVVKEAGLESNTMFWKPEDGSNKLRMLSGFKLRASHYLKSANKYFTCTGENAGCQYCIANNTLPKAEQSYKISRFLAWVLLRKPDGKDEVVVGELPFTIMKKLKVLRSEDDWKFEKIPHYDINVTKTGEKQNTEYDVLPSPNKDAITPEQQVAFDAAQKGFSIEDFVQREKDEVSANLPKVEPAVDTTTPFSA